MNILRLNEVLKKTGLSKASIYQYMRKDKFPKKIDIGIRAVGWVDSEIDLWIEGRMKDR